MDPDQRESILVRGNGSGSERLRSDQRESIRSGSEGIDPDQRESIQIRGNRSDERNPLMSEGIDLAQTLRCGTDPCKREGPYPGQRAGRLFV